MFDRVSDAAEKLATGISRRGFLGSVGRWAGAGALGLAGVLATNGSAQAGTGKKCCVYYIPGTPGATWTRCVNLGDPCPPGANGGSYTVAHCGQCN